MQLIDLPSAASNLTDVEAEQVDLTSIRITWSPSDGANGYIISYSRGDIDMTEDISSGLTSSHTLTGLVEEATYTISIIATSQHFNSHPVMTSVTLGESLNVLSLV